MVRVQIDFEEKRLNEQPLARSGSFEQLTPGIMTDAIESAFGLRLDGLLTPYPSYVNRVYGLRDEDKGEYVVKFYRPTRWSNEALRDEHRFLLDCAGAELPIVAPVADEEGETLQVIVLELPARIDSMEPEATIPDSAEGNRAQGEPMEVEFPFALFPKMGGRNFDPETDDAWRRLGALAGRLHQVARKRAAPSRAVCNPELTSGFVDRLLAEDVVHPDAAEELESLCRETIDFIRPLFDGVQLERVHGDLHRGNILDRPGTGLVLFDFDDMMNGPAVQDLWLLLPGRTEDSRRELEILLEAYEEFSRFDRATLALIEPLRFMRMVYFLAWRASQRHDYWFRSSFPDWGTRAFWLKENEDLRDQARVIEGG